MPIKAQKYPVFNSDKELSDFLLSNLTDSLKQSIKITVTCMVRQEMENLRKESPMTLWVTTKNENSRQGGAT